MDDEFAQVMRACERLRVPLTGMVGRTGYISLLSRALVLAKRGAPVLEGARIEPDGSLSGLMHAGTEVGKRGVLLQGGEALISEVLNLLVTFIGEALTLSLLGEAVDKTALGAPILSTRKHDEQP